MYSVAGVETVQYQESASLVEKKKGVAGYAEEMKKKWTASPMCKINGEIPVVIYTSNRSRLRVAVAKTPGPLVKGIISFVTETMDNDGLPHTLEHLIFMGSQKYPYKGMLDLVASGCLASGTNASTHQDHTLFTLDTVGSQGFLKVLPVYLDHVLWPTLKDAQFLTEVHHIDGKGEDAGVVYGEMQDFESEMSWIVHWKRLELFYPEYSPYRVEVGGRLAALRTTCNMEKIRKFHREFYHTSNMFLMVCGSIDHTELLQIMGTIEETSQQRVPHLFNKPFSNTMLAFKESAETLIICPNEDEKLGMVVIAWKGPDEKRKLKTVRRLEVLGHYLCDTAASPLEQDFVQLEEQLASSVDVQVTEQCVCEIVFTFNGVPADKLEDIKTRLFDKTLYSFTRDFDEERMKNTITQLIDKELSQMETDCHGYVFELLCMHQIYGTNSELQQRLNYVAELRKMLDVKPERWCKLADEYLTKEYVCVYGRPSRDEVTRIAASEKERIKEQRIKLGKSGLKRCGEELKKALNETANRKPPPELLSETMVHELEDFVTFKVKTLHALTGHNNDEIFKLPLPIYIHSAGTHFVNFVLVYDTKLIPLELRIWLMLYLELMFQSPAMIDGEKKSYTEVAKLFTRDLVSYDSDIGVLDRFLRFCSISLKAPPARYVTMLSWLTTFANGIIFEAERIKVAAKKLVAAADEDKRDGHIMRNTLLKTTLHDPDSNKHMYGVVQLEKFHKNMIKLMDQKPSYVVGKLEKLRQALKCAPVNVHIICNTDQIMPFLPVNLGWLYKERKNDPEMSTGFRDLPGDSLGFTGFGKQRVMAIAACESSFLKQATHFKYKLGSEEALCVDLIAQYLSQTEGPLYRIIRGNGLAYSVKVKVNEDSQLLTFSIDRSAQLERAYQKSKEIVFNELEHMDVNEFEVAKRSLVSEIVQDEDTVIFAADRAVCNQFRGLEPQFWREYCERIWNSSMEKVLECGNGFIRDLFDDKKCCRAITVPHGKLKGIKEYFKGIEVVKSSDLHVKCT